jgi:hypothetical protein
MYQGMNVNSKTKAPNDASYPLGCLVNKYYVEFRHTPHRNQSWWCNRTQIWVISLIWYWSHSDQILLKPRSHNSNRTIFVSKPHIRCQDHEKVKRFSWLAPQVETRYHRNITGNILRPHPTPVSDNLLVYRALFATRVSFEAYDCHVR